jgi:hypothetical protein
MGWGMSMGIGWPNASAQSTPPVYIYFTINSLCNGAILEGVTTQAILEGVYSSGDYVYSPTAFSRALLGGITNEPGKTIYNVTGQIYPDCEE